MSLKAAILGFLSLEPTSGYTLKQRFDGSVSSFWSVTQSQIYRELHALEREKLVAVHRQHGDGKPDRKVYELTDEGRRELSNWLRQPLEPLHLRHPLLLKFVFSADIDPEHLDLLLEQFREEMVGTLEEYVARLTSKEIFSLARSPREAEIWRLSIEHGVAWCNTEIEWVDQVRKRLAHLDRSPQNKKTKKRGR